MDDCVAAVTAAMAACRRCKQRIKNINQQLALVLGVAPRGRCNRVPRTHLSAAFASCVVQQLRPRYRLDVVGGRLHRQFCLHGTLRP